MGRTNLQFQWTVAEWKGFACNRLATVDQNHIAKSECHANLRSGRSLSVNRAMIAAALALFVAANVLAQEAKHRRVPLFQQDQSCVCIAAKKETKTAKATETRVGKSVYQVFWSRTERKKELFRVQVGTAVGEDAEKWWNYGIADEADFNADGTPDYSWYGGDDTGFEMYLFLSSAGHYKRVNILKTVEVAWQRRFHRAAPDLGDAGGGYCLSDTALEQSDAGLTLLAKVERVTFEGTKQETYRFRVSQVDFRP